MSRTTIIELLCRTHPEARYVVASDGFCVCPVCGHGDNLGERVRVYEGGQPESVTWR
jgi:hypothetical protein